ncbi:MAG: acetolactate synthase small subunit [Clostridiales bacterium]|nr:acetolactate synthase small subunit [Clostridiales bacterium]
MKQKDEHVLSIMADNKFGVLTRIINGVRREGCNIKSLTAARTQNKDYSKITINIECYEYLLNDIIDRMVGLNCVKSLSKYEAVQFVEREYAIFSVKNECLISENIIKKYHATKIRDNIYELTGNRETISDCIDALAKSVSVDIARTGSIILQIPDEEEIINGCK